MFSDRLLRAMVDWLSLKIQHYQKQRRLHCGIKRRCCQPERVKDGLWQTKTFKQNIQTKQTACSVFRSSFDYMKITFHNIASSLSNKEWLTQNYRLAS